MARGRPLGVAGRGLRLVDGHVIPRDRIVWYAEQYLRGEADKADLRASPLRAPKLSGQPPALIVTAGFDPLRDEGEAYAARLAAAGVPVSTRRFDGQIHAFFQMLGVFPAAREAIDGAGAELRSAFA